MKAASSPGQNSAQNSQGWQGHVLETSKGYFFFCLPFFFFSLVCGPAWLQTPASAGIIDLSYCGWFRRCFPQPLHSPQAGFHLHLELYPTGPSCQVPAPVVALPPTGYSVGTMESICRSNTGSCSPPPSA